MTYYLGSVVALTTTVEVNGVPTNAGAVSLIIQSPDTTTATFTPTNSTTGVYTYDYTPVTAGHYVYRFVATGTGASATEGEFDVRAEFTPGLISLADLKSHLSFPANDDGSYDDKLQEFIDAATEIIEEIVGPILPATVTEVFNGGNEFIVLPDRNITAITYMAENRGLMNYILTEQPLGESVDAFGYTWDRTINKIVRRGFGGGTVLFPIGMDNVVVTYTVGLPAVPGNVLMATKELITHWWRWGQEGQRTGNPTLGAQGDDAATTSNAYAVPNRVVELLNPRKIGPGIA